LVLIVVKNTPAIVAVALIVNVVAEVDIELVAVVANVPVGLVALEYATLSVHPA
jgi:hypothetical protein